MCFAVEESMLLRDNISVYIELGYNLKILTNIQIQIKIRYRLSSIRITLLVNDI